MATDFVVVFGKLGNTFDWRNHESVTDLSTLIMHSEVFT